MAKRRSLLRDWKPTKKKKEEPEFETLRAKVAVTNSKIAGKIARFLISELGLQASWWGSEVLIRGDISDKALAETKRVIVCIDLLYKSIRK